MSKWQSQLRSHIGGSVLVRIPGPPESADEPKRLHLLQRIVIIIINHHDAKRTNSEVGGLC